MSQWTFVLFMFGIIVTGVSALFNARRVMIGTVAGYAVGFALGMIFGRTYYMYVGNELWVPRHNAWQIWTGAYLLLVLSGIVWEFLSRKY